MGKKIKKAVKKVTKTVKKAVKQVGKPVEKVVKGAVGAVTGGGGAQVVEVPVQQPATAAPSPAQLVDVPTQENVETEDEAQTEAGRRKARAGGKKSLSVARASGGGLNI